MGIVSDIKRSVKIDNMSYDEAVSEIKLLLSDSDKWIFEEMLNNYKKYDAKGNRFPLSKLRLVLRKQVLDKKFDILNNRQYGLKSAYVTHFKNDIYSIKSKKFKDKFKSIRKYEEYVKEQEKYTEFSGVDKLYKEKGETKKTSNYYSNVSSNYFMLETEEEKIKYLEEKYEIQFGIHVSIYSYNLKEKETEYFNKLAESEIENEKRKKEEKEEKKNFLKLIHITMMMIIIKNIQMMKIIMIIIVIVILIIIHTHIQVIPVVLQVIKRQALIIIIQTKIISILLIINQQKKE